MAGLAALRSQPAPSTPVPAGMGTFFGNLTLWLLSFFLFRPNAPGIRTFAAPRTHASPAKSGQWGGLGNSTRGGPTRPHTEPPVPLMPRHLREVPGASWTLQLRDPAGPLCVPPMAPQTPCTTDSDTKGNHCDGCGTQEPRIARFLLCLFCFVLFFGRGREVQVSIQQTLWGDRIVSNENVEWPCCTPERNMVLYTGST